MSRKDRVRWFLVPFMVCLLLVGMMPYTVSGESNSKEAIMQLAFVPHDPFVIIGDANFSDTASAEGWSGDGSSGSPYIIESLEINLGPSPYAAINISDTRAHFIIRGCSLLGPAATPSYGIYMDNVTNGQIENSQAKEFSHAVIVLGGSRDLSFSHNNWSYNSFSMLIQDSSFITMIDNICTGNFNYGIHLSNSSNCTLSSNNCSGNGERGITLELSSDDNIIENNICSGNGDRGITLELSSDDNIIENNICNANSQFGIHLDGSSSNNVTRNYCAFNLRGIFMQNHGDYNNLVDNRCTNNTQLGMLLMYADLNTIIGNNCSYNTDNGMHMWRSHNNTVAGGIYNSNGINGIWVSSDFNNVTLNICSGNDDGIYLDGEADYNIVTWNVFEASISNNGRDPGGASTFDYNYWSDYSGVDADEDGIGDTAYTFTANSDSNPLMYYPFPPEFEQTPADQAIEFGMIFSYQLDFIVTATTAPHQLSVDDSVNFAIDAGDTIISRTALEVGVYPLEVLTTNIYDFTTVGVFTVTVADTTPPTVTDAEDISFLEGEGGDYELQWTLSDLSPLNFILLRNGTEVTSSSEPTTAVYFSRTIEDLAPGVYNYTIVATDIWDNMAYDTSIVTVLPIPLLETLLPWLFVGAAAVVIVIVSVAIFRRRKSS